MMCISNSLFLVVSLPSHLRKRNFLRNGLENASCGNDKQKTKLELKSNRHHAFNKLLYFVTVSASFSIFLHFINFYKTDIVSNGNNVKYTQNVH